MADEKIEDRSDEMEHDLHKLEDHISEAEKKLEARKEDADIADDVAGDWDGEQDRGGGDDPVGAKEDADQPASDQEPAGGDQDEGAPEDDDPDERVDDEVANPT